VTLVHTLLNHKDTKVKTVLVVCPLSTVLNWVNEFSMWLKDIGDGGEVNVFELSK
jgi:transcriptional regulator ATRX